MRSDADIEQAIDAYGDAVLRACVSQLHNRHDAEDAFQETFIRYATGGVVFADEDHRRAWLIRVAVNLCRDHLRRASSHSAPLDEVAEPVDSAPSEHDRFDERERMQAALMQLTPDQRSAIVLSVVEGYPVPEVARIMGKPVNTVYSFITRGKRRLKEVLGS